MTEDPFTPSGPNPVPLDFGQSHGLMRRASAAHRDAADARADASKQYANAERDYRLALAKEMLRLKSSGTAQTVTADLARGAEHVAALRHERDLRRGQVRAADIYAKSCEEDRHDIRELARWSRDVAPNGEQRQDDVDRPFAGRAAA